MRPRGGEGRGRGEGGAVIEPSETSQQGFVDPALRQVTRGVSEHVLELVGFRHQETDVLQSEGRMSVWRLIFKIVCIRLASAIKSGE